MPIILHIDMDYFFAQIEERKKPWLKTRPVIVGAHPKKGQGRGVVSTCNYLARKFGVHSGMAISEAYRLCSHAAFLPVRGKLYGTTSGKIMKLLCRNVGQGSMEQVSVDEAYLDVSWLESFSAAKKFGLQLQQSIWKAEQLTASVGIGPNKMIAKIASGFKKPRGLTVITPEQVNGFLQPMRVGVLPGVGEKAALALTDRGINKVSDLLEYPEANLVAWFGKFGHSLYQEARGVDDRTIVTSSEVKSIGRQETFAEDTRDKSLVTKTLIRLAREVWEEMREKKFRFRTVTVTCRYKYFETLDRSKTIASASEQFVTFKSLVLQLFLPLFLDTKKPIRLAGVRLSKFQVEDEEPEQQETPCEQLRLL